MCCLPYFAGNVRLFIGRLSCQLPEISHQVLNMLLEAFPV